MVELGTCVCTQLASATGSRAERWSALIAHSPSCHLHLLPSKSCQASIPHLKCKVGSYIDWPGQYQHLTSNQGIVNGVWWTKDTALITATAGKAPAMAVQSNQLMLTGKGGRMITGAEVRMPNPSCNKLALRAQSTGEKGWEEGGQLENTQAVLTSQQR